MNDFYTEQLVKRKSPAWTMPAKILLILVTVVSFTFILMFPLAILIPVALIVLDVFLFRGMNVEYEYLYVNGNLDVDKIMSKSRRKKIFEMEINDMEIIAPAGSPEMQQYQGIKAYDFSSGTQEARLYEMVVLKKGEKRRIIFEPNDVILEGMRMIAPRKVFL